jgi:VCBS repeat-containing protein
MSNTQAQAVAVSNIRNRNFMIASVDSNGNWSMAPRPTFHGVRSAAEAEADRLSLNSADGKIYVVLGAISGSQRPVAVPVTRF